MLALILLAGINWGTVGPLGIAQGWDAISTQRSLSYNGHCYRPDYTCWQSREGNPLPGMQSFGGRTAWGLAELSAVHVLSQRKPKLGRWVAWTLTATHIFLGARNWHHANQARDWTAP